MQSTPRTEDLFTLLDETAHLPPEYAEGLSNHLPMALHALHEMGAAPPRLRAFTERYSVRFTPWPHATQGRVLADWTQARGHIAAYADLRATFGAVLQAQGREGALRQLLPALWPGVAAAAFHGLIRTAHAVRNGHEGELAAGLAYWAARWQPMAPPQSGPGLAASEWADALSAQGGAQRFAGRLISDRMAAAQHAPVYCALAGRLPREVQALPVASDDDHVVKLIHACIEEAAVYGEGAYLLAARRAVA
jgi:hypothetical protein